MSVELRVFSKLMRYAIEPLRKKGIWPLHIQYKETDNQVTKRKAIESNLMNQAEFGGDKDMSMDCSSFGENNVSNPGDWRSSSSCTVPSERFSEKLDKQPQLLGSPMLITTGCTATEWPTNNETNASTTSCTIHVDASNSGWSFTSKTMKKYESWALQVKEQPISVRGFKVIAFAIQAHATKFQGQTMQILSDNRTALKHASKASGTASRILQKLALNIQKLCNKHHLTVLYQHIAGKPNTETDVLSQIQQQIHHHALLKTIFRKIEYHWSIKLKADAFASNTNKKLNKYWSWNQDLGAEAVDAFKQRWLRKDIYLYFP
ncbi:hypothetical protein RMCBS344292_18461 [Rhizopus microsporus]|nr:hypothetical protein RMCBS344292_18461 [Rhizopus microsporus]